MKRIMLQLGTWFGLGIVACLLLAIWALWTAGPFEGPAAQTVRTTSIYVAPGIELDTAAAEQIIGNRRLVVLMLESGADLSAACDGLGNAAAGTLVLAMAREDDEFDTYGCGFLAGGEIDEEGFGGRAVAETRIGSGLDGFVDRPLDALKVVVINYDQLVDLDVLPPDARTFSPSLPRYLIAAAAITAVVGGALALFLVAQRAGGRAAVRSIHREESDDSRAVLSAEMALVARQIIDIDGLPGHRRAAQHARLAVTYSTLLDEITSADREGRGDYEDFTARAKTLSGKLRGLE
ncbi:hypothetical protein [Pseudonocardia sp. MH-G8]|uniref:hypothetical protein n=1 Tax=Pseudonocardia sp. MH-G8 TaxID=1854588 RepID=UPI000BA15BE3|nr:hypothetical protein [Pseudonocardia sp. MH-G8]OZM83133.1 hypothetical protein CFP66_00720 [Pseudonocardia sp. MH-G8]